MRSNYTLNSLSRWSSKSKDLPDISNIKSLHVYDFDNTLFSSALPNPQLWNAQTASLLQSWEIFAHGGWWHDPGILASTGEGIEIEEPRAWEGWWNETVVQLVEASMKEKDALTVLLTGRGDTNFADLINRICNSKKLDFDMVVLKPEVGPHSQKFPHTIDFKQTFLRDLVYTYKNAQSIRIYEDRIKHVKAFREHFEQLNKEIMVQGQPADKSSGREVISADVIHVCELRSNLDPEKEVMAVQLAINRHNQVIRSNGPNPTGSTNKLLRITENFLYFGYLISQTDSARLITLCNTSPHLIDSGEVKYMASSILIAPYYPRKDTLEKVGGRGKKVTWQVNGVAKFEDRIWAVRVAPVTDTPIYTKDDTPMVILAIRKGSRTIDAQRIKNWQPVAPEKQFIFETVVGDKMMLKIEDMDESNDIGHGGNKQNTGYRAKRKFGHHDDESRAQDNYNSDQVRADGTWAAVASKGGNGNGRYFGNKPNKQFHHRKGGFNNKPAGTDQSQPGKRGGGGGGGRGRGGNRGAGYRSLDDYGGASFDGANDAQVPSANAMVMNY